MDDHRMRQQSMQSDYRLEGTSYPKFRTKKPKTREQSEDYKITKAKGACDTCRRRRKKCDHNLPYVRQPSQLQDRIISPGHSTGQSRLEHPLPEAPGYPLGSHQVGLGNGAGAGIRTVLASTVRPEASEPTTPYIDPSHPPTNATNAELSQLEAMQTYLQQSMSMSMSMPMPMQSVTAPTHAFTTNSSFESPASYTSYDSNSQSQTHVTTVYQPNYQHPHVIYNYIDPSLPANNQQPDNLHQYTPYYQMRSRNTQSPNNHHADSNSISAMNGGESSASALVPQTDREMWQETSLLVREAGAWSNDTIDPSLLQIPSESNIHTNSLENYPCHYLNEDTNGYWSYQ